MGHVKKPSDFPG